MFELLNTITIIQNGQTGYYVVYSSSMKVYVIKVGNESRGCRSCSRMGFGRLNSVSQSISVDYFCLLQCIVQEVKEKEVMYMVNRHNAYGRARRRRRRRRRKIPSHVLIVPKERGKNNTC